MNKILYPPLIVIGICIPIYIYALIDRSVNSIAPMALLSLLLLFVLWKSMDNFWFHRRLPVMCPKQYKKVRVEIDSYSQTGDVYDEESEISYRYDAKKKVFLMSRTMYMNPFRYPKEYEERKYQFKTRIEQLRIPIYGWISEPKSTIRFDTSVRLEKKYATPENIKKIRETILDLAKNDYSQNVYSKFVFEDNLTLYMETFRYKLVKAMLVQSDVVVERYSPEGDNDASQIISDKLASLFKEMCNQQQFDKLTKDDMIDKLEFYQIWNNTVCQN